MLDCYSSDGASAFQFGSWGDVSEELEDYGLTNLDPASHDPDDGVLIVLRPSGKGSWYYDKVITGDELKSALAAAGLLA